SLLRPEKMPGYANKQGAPTLNAVNVFAACPIVSSSSVSQASVIEIGVFGIASSNISNDHFIYNFGNKLTVRSAQFECVKNKDKEFQVAFGKHLKKLRNERNWSQGQLAAFLNIDSNQISRIENGKHAVNIHTIRSL